MTQVLKGTGEGPLPPILQQYVELKQAFPDYLLLYQIGDFFETFGEEAETLAQLLNLTLTQRNSKEFTTPMAGIPVRSVEAQIERLLRAGYRVAVAEQMEAKSDSEGLVAREITQLITPGTVTNEVLLPADANYLAAISQEEFYGLVLLDLSTGEFTGTQVSTAAALLTELERYRPAELLVDSSILQDQGLKQRLEQHTLVLEVAKVEEAEVQAVLEKQFGRQPQSLSLPALGRAAAMALTYAAGTQQGSLPQITRFQLYDPMDAMLIDEASLTSLEVFQANSPSKGRQVRTLFNALNATRAAPGRRLLKSWLRRPLLDAQQIKQRLDAVEMFVKNKKMRNETQKLLSRTQDLERLATRLSTRKVGPRDVKALEHTLAVIPDLQRTLAQHEGVFAWFEERRSFIESLLGITKRAIVEDPPTKAAEGGFIKDGYDAELDALRNTSSEVQAWMQALEKQERKATGISALKISSNSVLGFFFEVTKANYERVPEAYELIQTLKDRQRYTRADLRQKQHEMQLAEEEAKTREREVFSGLIEDIAKHIPLLRSLSQMLARVDVYASLAEVATTHRYCRPKLDSNSLNIEQGRHPVVERHHNFVRNDLELSPERSLIILTGPNMSGKSTYLRQTALISIMAQIGSFVPANKAILPIFDRIYTRIGASDDLAGGRSTFMVEMQELARILETSTSKSLVLLDEIGRGTSTYDGLALAWAATEYMHDSVCAFTLFATHYFELTHLADQLPRADNQHVAAEELENDLVFYHQVLPGPASRSYGIEVARLAGLPKAVVTRAQVVLGDLQADAISTACMLSAGQEQGRGTA